MLLKPDIKKAVAALDNKNSNWTWLTPENYIQRQ